MSALGNSFVNPFISPFQPSHGVSGGPGPVESTLVADFAADAYTVNGVPVSQASLLSNVNSTGGYVPNSDGSISLIGANLPRIGAGSGLLIEEARTNICLQSNAFATSSWVTNGIPPPVQNVTGPDLVANSAWTLTDDGGGTELITQTITVANDSSDYSFSIYVEKDTDETRFPAIFFSLVGGTNVNELLHINTMTGAGVEEIGDGSFTIEDSGGWWRVQLNITNNNTGNTTLFFNIYPARGDVIGVSNGAAQGSIIVFGCQVEVASFSTSYIATGASAVARSTDDVSFIDISWFDADKATFLVEYTPLHDSAAFSSILQADDGTNNNRAGLGQENGTDARVLITRASVPQADLMSGGLSQGVLSKIGFAWESDAALSLDGGIIDDADTVLGPIGVTDIDIGSRAGGTSRMPAAIYDQITFWPERKSDSFLSSITQ